MLLGRKFSFANLTDKTFDRLGRDFLKICVAFHKLRSEIVKQPQHIVDDQHLAIALGAGADTDGWDRQPLSDLSR